MVWKMGVLHTFVVQIKAKHSIKYMLFIPESSVIEVKGKEFQNEEVIVSVKYY